MDQADRYKLKSLVAAMYSAVCAGPYDDAATNTMLSLYPSILLFWNRRLAHHCQSVKQMRNSPTQSFELSRMASTQEKEKYQESRTCQLSHLAAINTECEAAERMSRVIDVFLEKRGQLVIHRGFTLAVQFGRGDEDAEPDARLLIRGIRTHLAHWEPWWAALEGFLRYIHQDLQSTLAFFRRFFNSDSTSTNRAGVKVIGVLEIQLKRLLEVDTLGMTTLTMACVHEEPRLTIIQDSLARRTQLLQKLKDSLSLLHKTFPPQSNAEKQSRKRKRDP